MTQVRPKRQYIRRMVAEAGDGVLVTTDDHYSSPDTTAGIQLNISLILRHIMLLDLRSQFSVCYRTNARVQLLRIQKERADDMQS